MDHRTRSIRLTLAAIMGLGGALLATGAAAAAPPTREFAALPDFLLDDSCGYTIEVTFPTNREYLTTFYDQAGEVTRIHITGALVATFTNADTGASLTANISGPSHVDVVRGTSTGEGNWALWPDGTLTLLAGRSDFVEGTFHGRVVLSICDALAP